jgi:uncharacterized Zn finger protein
VSWRLDLLKDKQIADTYRAQIKDLSHVVIDAMSTKTSQHQVDKVFEQVADVIRRQQAFRSVARSVGTRHCMVDTRVCCDPPDTGGV